eukprot:1265539-Pyramimonas_sp.AAC.1
MVQIGAAVTGLFHIDIYASPPAPPGGWRPLDSRDGRRVRQQGARRLPGRCGDRDLAAGHDDG